LRRASILAAALASSRGVYDDLSEEPLPLERGLPLAFRGAPPADVAIVVWTPDESLIHVSSVKVVMRSQFRPHLSRAARQHLRARPPLGARHAVLFREDGAIECLTVWEPGRFVRGGAA
jgi:hypothetical protein